MREVKFDKNFLKSIFFIGSPLVFAFIICMWFEHIIDLKKVMVFVTFSSWLFSFFSIVLIFVVWEKVRESVVRKNVRDKKYLDIHAISELESAIENIYLIALGNKEIDQLSENSRIVKYIYRKLENQKQDTELYSLMDEVAVVFNDINKFKLESIGKNMDSEKWDEINERDKEIIVENTFNLSKELKMLSKDIK